MKTELIQFNAGAHVLGGRNIAEAVCTAGGVAFNESYIVVGDCLKARSIYAAYDLTVHGDLTADEITVYGSLVVTGDLEANVLECRGKLLCTGAVRVKQLSVDGFAAIDSLSGDSIQAGGDLFVRTTADANRRLEAAGLLVAAEGIMGAGTLNVSAAIAGEYVEFDGTCSGDIWELSAAEPGPERRMREPDAPPPPDRLRDRLAAIAQTGRVTSLMDFLLAFWASKEFPEALPSCGALLEEAAQRTASLPFHADELGALSDALYVLARYRRELPLSFEDCADKIFSSIGLRYATVRRAMEVRQ